MAIPNPIFVPMTVSVDSVEIGMGVGSNQIDIPFSTDTVINVEVVDVPEYTGEYVVTPLAYEQTILETTGLRMTDDVTVLEIPIVSVSNPSGGNTVTIGG